MKGNKNFLTLGIESSCDETGIGIISEDRKVESNMIYSQAEIHDKYGGVVPEIASRKHLSKISPLLIESLESAGLEIGEIDLVAATYGPGLVGPLLVGLSVGKGLSFGLDVPFIGVNHLEAHLFTHYLTGGFSPPFLALLVSGGHTCLVSVKDWGNYEVLGQTRDDAAGEAFDKVGYLTGLGYPAGRKIDSKSKSGDRKAIDFPRPMLDKGLDFSFAGLKTAVVQRRKEFDDPLNDLLASFQEAVVDTLLTKAFKASDMLGIDHLVVIGGVAANSRLREKFNWMANEKGKNIQFPELKYCTDNGIMTAVCGAYRYRNFGEKDDLELGPDPSLKLG